MSERALFLDALEIADPAQRATYLDRACAGDPALRAGVEELLKAHTDPGPFMDRPAPSLVATADGPVSEGPGTVIGPYKLLEQIGEGGFGVVFMAEQHQPMRRRVALKVLKPGMETRQVVARFEAERQALALMDHPNIARVLDGGETESGRPYFVMELVRGIPITEFCDQDQLPVRQRLELFVSVCQAVQHAHHKGVIHRDLKPSNVLVTLHDGTPVAKVIDFGVAKATGQQLTDKTLFTGFAQMIGTPLYMSPEQAALSGLDVDTRSDIYSLGVLLYELLTGTTPFDRERFKTAGYDEIRRIIREEEPARPSTRLSTPGRAGSGVAAGRKGDPKRLGQLFRGELDWVVMKALEKDRSRRYETAGALAADVQRYLRDEAVLACPPSVGYRLRKFVRHHRGPMLAAALIFLALVVGIIGTTLGLIRATGAEAEALLEAEEKADALQDREAALQAARQSEEAAREQLFVALLSQARAGRFSRQMGQRLDSLEALAKAARIRPDERLRDEAIAALALPDVRRGASWTVLPPGYVFYNCDAHYRVYVSATREGVISVRSIPDNKEIRRIVAPQSGGKGVGVGVSPDGKYVTWAEGLPRTLRLWRVADGQPVLREQPHPHFGLAFSPDGRQLVVGEEGWFVRYDLTTGRQVNRWPVPEKAQTCVMAFHPDNRRLAVGYIRSDVASVYDASTGKLLAELAIGPGWERQVAWHPDGRRLAVSRAEQIQIWDVAARRKLATLEGHVQQAGGLFHPDGSLLASNSWDGTVRLWDPATGRQLMQLTLPSANLFSPDGRILGVTLATGAEAQLLEVTPSREYRTFGSSLGAGQGDYYEGDLSADGRLLALDMGPNGIHFWDVAGGREVTVLPQGIPVFPPGGREFLSCGDGELWRWPLADRAEKPDGPPVGAPRKMVLPLRATRVARSHDGRTLAVVSEDAGAALLVDLAKENVPARRFPHPRAQFVALSGDGQRLATGGWHSYRVRLWDAGSGKMVHEWPLHRAKVFFSPDGRTLIISQPGELSFWDLATMKVTRRLRRDVAVSLSHVAFTQDGKLMALEMAPGVIELKEVATARTVAKLEDPHGDRAWWMGFTPDGTRLVVSAHYAKAVHVWNLRAIRVRLKAMGLDWDWPEFAPAAPAGRHGEALKLEILPGDLIKLALTHEEKARQAIARLRRQVAANPNSAGACNDLAWTYLTAPGALRDAKAALPLAEKAVRLDPGNANYRNTLGLAYYRAGRYREAVDTLRPNLKSQEDAGLAYDLYFLAMSCHRLGEAARARDYYDWAVRWTGAQRGFSATDLEELAAFRAEAEQVLGIGLKKD
jgi:serine/threonine protein kinase/WD40 repeat protein